MAEQDDWQPVSQPAPQDDWKPVGAAPPSHVSEGFDALNDQPPPAFIDRIARGAVVMRDFMGGAVKYSFETGKAAGEAGIEATAAQLRSINERLNPVSDASRAGHESGASTGPGSTLGTLGGLWDLATLPLAPIGGAASEIIAKPMADLGGKFIPIEEARDAVGKALFAMRAPNVRFGRAAGPVEQPIGGLPTEQSFRNATDALGGQATEANLRRMWAEDGIHPAEAVHDAQRDAFVKHQVTSEPVAIKADPEAVTQIETEGAPVSLSAAATDGAPYVPLDRQPAPPSGTLMTRAHDAGNALLDVGRDIQMKVAPMATGTNGSMAIVKDFMNTTRRNRWEWSRYDTDLEKRFDPEQRTRMFNAADEESVARQLGESREHQGLVTLEPAERAAVEDAQSRAQMAWLRARDLGMVEGEGLPAYTPRMVMNAAREGVAEGPVPLNGFGYDLRTKTPNMRQRKYMTVEETEAAAKAKYGEQAYVARDIRALPLATAQLEDAIAGRTLINAIKEYGKATGTETVAEGAIPAGSETKWFTVDHPAFKTWRPKFEPKEGGGVQAVKDAEGNVMFEQVPLYIHGDFEGPLQAAFWGKTGDAYAGLMSLKGKTMSLIMNSPMIHNMVEFGRAFPAMPLRIFKAYFDGNRAKNDVAVMTEAIDAGLVPIGKRFFNQDITSVMESPDLTPGRSWTAKIAGFVPGLFDEAAGVAVKRAIDKAGDFWHNTLLWDRIADLQMGLYTNFRGDFIAKGMDAQTASRTAAHLANRYAGALPKEAMSEAATKIANLMLFSRSFTIGNLGVIKDAITGLPKDVLAQIERDAGQTSAQAVARRKAQMTLALDIGLAYAGYSLFQNMSNVLLSDSTVEKEAHGYVRRAQEVMNDAKVHPLSLLQPFSIMDKLSAAHENEPGRQDRVRVGQTKDGTAIYARNPVGKIGEEFVNYFSSPIDMLKKKEGTLARPLLQVITNDKGFGRKVYDPNADTPARYAGNVWAIAKHFMTSQIPEGQINAAWDLVKGDGDPTLNKLQAFGPFAGVTFSKGAPGGPAVGELYKAREQHDFAVQQELPDIRKQIQRGDITGAQQRMTALGVPPGLQRFYIRTSQFPETRLGGRTLKDFYQYATPEQIQRLERARGAQP